ncbi:flagellar export protein FliJ [bacterium]|nr:flagellar export protein FliJ [bacterium]
MKPFHFSLQAVRTLRQRQEQQALEAFARTVQARQAAIDRQKLAERELSVGLDQLARTQTDGAPIYRLNQLRDHCRGLEQKLAVARKQCVKAQEAANAAWETLQEARQQLELVDKLYQRRSEEYERELRQEEQKQLDEMSSRRWIGAVGMTQPTALAWN